MIELAVKYGLRVSIYRIDNDLSFSYEPSGAIAHLWEEVEERAALLEFGPGFSRENAEREAARRLMGSDRGKDLKKE